MCVPLLVYFFSSFPLSNLPGAIRVALSYDLKATVFVRRTGCGHSPALPVVPHIEKVPLKTFAFINETAAYLYSTPCPCSCVNIAPYSLYISTQATPKKKNHILLEEPQTSA